jgi:hypothetical protein
MSMLLELEAIPSLYNIYASFFAWILLAGCTPPLTMVESSSY